jgi:flagellar biosynthetic protein FliO
MSRQGGQLPEGGSVGAVRRAVIVGAWVTVLALAARADAGGSSPAQSYEQAGGHGLVEEQQAGRQGTPAAPVLDDALPSDSEPVPDSSASAATQRFTKASAGERTALRRRVSGVEGGTLEQAPTPWYRSAISSLAVVLVLVGLAFYLVRRFVPAARAVDGGILRVVARATLSPKQSVALVHVGRRFVMVGVSPDRLNTLCEIDGAEEVADLAARAGMNGTRRGRGFEEVLVREARELSESAEAAGDEVVRAGSRPITAREPLTDLLNRLRGLRSK